MRTQSPGTVFVVDDEPAARDSVAAVVESNGAAVRTFASAESFLEAFDPNEPGCLVSDFRMLQMSGLDLLCHLRASGCQMPILLVTAYADVPMTVQAMKLGAVTVLEKPCHEHHLWEAICAGLELDRAHRQRQAERRLIAARLATLTPDEQAILRSIVDGKPNKQIAAELDVSLRTVEGRRRMVFSKLAVSSVAELVRLAYDADETA